MHNHWQIISALSRRNQSATSVTTVAKAKVAHCIDRGYGNYRLIVAACSKVWPVVCIKITAATRIIISASEAFGGGVGAISSSCDGGDGHSTAGIGGATRARRFTAVGCDIQSLAAVAPGAIGGGVGAIGSSCGVGDGQSMAGSAVPRRPADLLRRRATFGRWRLRYAEKWPFLASACRGLGGGSGRACREIGSSTNGS